MHIRDRNALVEKNLGLVARAARRLNRFSMTYDERYSIGCEALIKSASKYDPSRSEFSTYFFWRFRNAMINEIQRDRNPPYMVSLDAPIQADGDEGMTLHDVIAAASEDALESITRRETRHDLKQAVARLPQPQRTVLSMRYLVDGGMPVRAVAEKLRKSNSWVVRREREALNSCRETLVC